MIGIIGGVGPYAGLDLARKVFDQTRAKKDQDHLPLILLSIPHQIDDRTDFLLRKTAVNPGIVLSKFACRLADAGAQVIGIPCNTAHAQEIFHIISDKLRDHNSNVVLLNMIDEIGIYIQKLHKKINKVGVLSTTGTLISNIYPKMLSKYDIKAIQVSDEIQNKYVHPAIYDPIYGIKSQSNPVSEKAYNNLLVAASYLIKKGAKAIILGCTEIPLSITEKNIEDTIIIDPTLILSIALIKSIAPDKLK